VNVSIEKDLKHSMLHSQMVGLNQSYLSHF